MEFLYELFKCGCGFAIAPLMVPLLTFVYGVDKASLYIKRVWCRRWIRDPVYSDMCIVGYKKDHTYVFFLEREFNSHWKIAECVKEFWMPGDSFVFVCVPDIYRNKQWDYDSIENDTIVLVGYDNMNLVTNRPIKFSDGTYNLLGDKLKIIIQA